MKRQNVIVCIQEYSKKPEVYGNFKKLCEDKGFVYNTLSRRKFPISHADFIIHKVKFK